MPVLAGGFWPLVKSLSANWSWVRCQTITRQTSRQQFTQPRATGATRWFQACGGCLRVRVCWPGLSPCGPPSSGPTTHKRCCRGWVKCVSGITKGGGPDGPTNGYRYSQAQLNMWPGYGEGLDSVPVRSCPLVKGVG